MEQNKKPVIGFIGQGYVGKNYADDFERRGYVTVRYSLEPTFSINKEKISECDIVFIGVPTPTTPEGFDDSVVREALGLIGVGKIAIIKSTIIPGTAKKLFEQYPDRVIFYSPEFLSEATAATDAANPFSNILGMAHDNEVHRSAAQLIHTILPPASYSSTCDSTEAELIKYAHNGSGYVQVVFFNLMYDLAKSLNLNWDIVEAALGVDPYISNRYVRPVHKSGRGAGGNCFIKDFAALRSLYQKNVNDSEGASVLSAIEAKNLDLLARSGKDASLVEGVYGPRTVNQ